MLHIHVSRDYHMTTSAANVELVIRAGSERRQHHHLLLPPPHHSPLTLHTLGSLLHPLRGAVGCDGRLHTLTPPHLHHYHSLRLLQDTQRLVL